MRGLLRTAYHEAAHAVASHYRPLGGKAELVTVVAKREDSPTYPAAGLFIRCPYVPPVGGRRVDHAAVADEFVMILAGVIGEEHYTGRAQNGGWCDLEIARQLDLEARRPVLHDMARAASLRGPVTGADLLCMAAGVTRERERSFAVYRREARRLVRTHWPEIRALAHALLERGELAGDEVREVIEAAERKLEARERPGTG